MKLERKLLLAILLLIGLVCWLIALSLQRPPSGQVTNALTQIQRIEQRLDQLEGPVQTQTIIRQVPVDGTNGISGSSGANGSNGVGRDGITIQGPMGLTGATGASAYDLWLSIGNTGTVTDFLNSLQGQNGTAARITIIRCNPIKLQNEWQYLGDTIWQPLDKVISCVGQ